MVIIPHVGKGVFDLSKFIDFDKNENIFYDNLYIKDYDFVIKIPILFLTKSFISKKEFRTKIKLEKFNLSKYTYLLDQE